MNTDRLTDEQFGEAVRVLIASRGHSPERRHAVCALLAERARLAAQNESLQEALDRIDALPDNARVLDARLIILALRSVA